MNRSPFLPALCCILLLAAGCSDRQRSDPNAAEWVEVEAMAGEAETDSTTSPPESSGIPSQNNSELAGEFESLAEQLEQMKSIKRRSGQTLLTGDYLVFDYQERFVRMDGNVLVDDDHGRLLTESLQGRFSEENQVEYIEARGDVSITADNRRASADKAAYDYLEGTVVMEGQAIVSEAGNRLSGEQIRFWLSENRKMICEPNAFLLVTSRSGLDVDGMPDKVGDTEIRANRIVYDEGKHQADLVGNVRLRNPQVALNCNKINLYLKDDNKIDWIEAVGDVIIQSEGRKALADIARYDAEEGKFTLEGQPPMVKMGRNVMTGDRITFWHETRVVLCEPNGRILYYYDLDEETQAKFPKDLND